MRNLFFIFSYLVIFIPESAQPTSSFFERWFHIAAHVPEDVSTDSGLPPYAAFTLPQHLPSRERTRDRSVDPPVLGRTPSYLQATLLRNVPLLSLI